MKVESSNLKNVDPQEESSGLEYARGVSDGKKAAYSEAIEMVGKVLFRLEHLSHSIDEITCGKIRHEITELKEKLVQKASEQNQG